MMILRGGFLSSEKGRDWTFVVYPESAPSNWRELLDDTHLRWIESPLHDKDLDLSLIHI